MVSSGWLRSQVLHGSQSWFEMRKLQRALTSRDHLRAVLPSTIPDGQGDQRHQADLPRLRDGRGSIILKTGPGSFVERESAPLDPPGVFGTSVSLLAPLPQPSATMNWWLVTPNAMAFENIAFTRPVALQATDKTLKLLIRRSATFDH